MRKIVSKKLAGVTMIEMLVVIGIVVVMTAITIIAMNPARQSAKIEAAQKELASEITLAKTYALQGKTQIISSAPKTPCGYGVYILGSQYTTYYISAADCETANEDQAYRRYTSVSRTDISSKTLPDGITANTGDFYFTVPSAKVFCNIGSELTGSLPASVILTGNGGLRKDVMIYSTGLVTMPE